jgi:hypothetical protein
MAKWIDASQVKRTQDLLAQVLHAALDDSRVQFLVEPSLGPVVVQRMRVALSRSRKRNLKMGRKVQEFTLHHIVYPYTTRDGKRHDCVVIWTEKNFHHRTRELLDDITER